MSVLVILEVPAQEGRGPELREIVVAMLAATRERAGCRGAGAYLDAERPDTVVVVEEWAARADHEAYVAWRAEQGDPEGIGALLAGAPATRYLELAGGAPLTAA